MKRIRHGESNRCMVSVEVVYDEIFGMVAPTNDEHGH